jgi:hypothetical protein
VRCRKVRKAFFVALYVGMYMCINQPMDVGGTDRCGFLFYSGVLAAGLKVPRSTQLPARVDLHKNADTDNGCLPTHTLCES